MADSILRLKVESQEYDNKLKRAAEGIQRLASKIHDSQGEFVGLTNDQKEFIKNLQYMNTVSQTATGKVKELETAYKGLQTMYNGFNAFEKNSEEGKILAEQLSVLKERTLQARKEMEDANKSLSNTGGFLDQLTSKFTVNIDAIKLFDIGMKAAGAALDVAKDAFFNNEQQLDEWGRVVESSESLYKGFLNALNTGDISGYLSNISNIVQAARDAYDALDELNTYNAFNQINVEKTRTNMTESIVDFMEGIGSKDAVREAGEAYKKELRDRQKKEEEAFKKRVGELAATRGVDAEGLESVLRGTYDDYKKKKDIQPTGERQTVIGAGAFARLGTENFAQNKLEKMAEALRNLNDTELQSVQSLGAHAERTGNEIAQVDRKLIRVLNGRSGSVGGGGKGGSGGGTTAPTYAADSIAAQSALVSELTKKFNESGEAVRNGMLPELVAAEAKLKSMKNEAALLKEQAAGKLQGGWVMKTNLGADSFAKDYLNIGEGLGKDFKLPVTQVESMTEALKQQQMAFNLAGQAANGFSAALSGMEDPAAKAAGQVVSAIASIAMGFAMASSNTNTAGTGWGWLAWLAAGASAMATTIATIHSLTGYAEGGIVKGNSYSGDNILANGGTIGLNAGELILNKSQQSTLASQMRDNGGFGDNFHAVLTGENIHIVHSRYLKRTGQGEIVTWR